MDFGKKGAGEARTYRLFGEYIARVVIVNATDRKSPSYCNVSPAPRSLRGRSEGELTPGAKGPDQGA